MSNSDSLESLKNLKTRIERFLSLDIESARKEFCLGQDSRDWKIEYAQKELKDTKNQSQNYRKIHYRPLDIRWTYYTGKSKGFHCMPRGEVMEHFLENENIGLNVSRQSKLNGGWQYAFITNSLVDLSLMGGGNTGAGYIFPLYLYPTPRSKKFLKKENPHFNEENFTSKIENFKADFRTFIDDFYKEKFSPEDILGYIYAVLFHKIYREKYLDFLKIDFPKIPFIKDKNTFKNLSKLGLKLINLHLLKDNELNSSIGEALFKNAKNKNFKIEKIKYNKDKKELFINENLYFSNVSSEIYEFKIGGYIVLDKYLKSHKGEDIDHNHFTLIIQTLDETLKIQNEISKINLA
ncbi:type ISP restriction/modification enzyme [Campylobacter taeniopygiae]|uniref:type ISP restriction/modification enzyme n=1 Tax=Campylobacter taeniopygiae TaxID=2510188 RepID=UPI003D6A790F